MHNCCPELVSLSWRSLSSACELSAHVLQMYGTHYRLLFAAVVHVGLYTDNLQPSLTNRLLSRTTYLPALVTSVIPSENRPVRFSSFRRPELAGATFNGIRVWQKRLQLFRKGPSYLPKLLSYPFNSMFFATTRTSYSSPCAWLLCAL